MDTGVTEAETPVASKDNKKKQKQKRKKRKLGAMMVDSEDDLPLSNEAMHFRTFVRRHFSIILRRMGKMLKYIKLDLKCSLREFHFKSGPISIPLLTFIISSAEFHKRKITSSQRHRKRIGDSQISPPGSCKSDST